MTYTLKKNLLVASVFLSIFMGVFDVANGAAPAGRYGYGTILSDILGDDNTCGGDENQELYLRESGSGNPISVQSGLFVVFNSDGTIARSAEGTGPIIGPLCFNPFTQKVGYSILGGSEHYDMTGTYAWQGTPLPGNKRMRTTLWLAPTSRTVPDYFQRSPVNIATNVNPSYNIDINFLPSEYGANAFKYANLYIAKYDRADHSIGNAFIQQKLPINGGTGTKTLPPQPLEDGMYVWSFYLMTNGSHDLGSVIVLSEPASGYSNFDKPFLLDRKAPVLSYLSHTENENPVTLKVRANDELAGLMTIKFYLDDALVATCSYVGSNTAACNKKLPPSEVGSTHTYFAVATDMVGNAATTSKQTFTVGTEVASEQPTVPTTPQPIVAPDCGGTTINNCVLHDAYAGSSQGTCEYGYMESCNYTCAADGSWIENMNMCARITATIQANPNVINEGERTTVSWSTNYTGGPGGGCMVSNPPYYKNTWWQTNNPGVLSDPIFVTEDVSSVRYILNCGGNPIAATEVFVNKIPRDNSHATPGSIGSPVDFTGEAGNRPVTITASAPIVREGNPVTVKWNTNGNAERSCTLTGGTLDNSYFNGTGRGSALQMIYSTTRFTLTCGENSDSVVVEIRPSGWES